MRQKILLLLTTVLLFSTSAFAQSGNDNPLAGDVNGDGIVDVADIVSVINIMQSGGGTSKLHEIQVSALSDIWQPKGEIILDTESNKSPFSAKLARRRATGTVGDTIAGNSRFNYEDIYVLMMDVSNPWWGYTDCGGTLGEQFNNTFFCRPTYNEATGTYSLEYNGFPGDAGGALKYYPMNGDSEFFGYYIDDAADVMAPGYTGYNHPVLTYNNGAFNGEALELPFTINGSQDIMAGKAYARIPNYDDTADTIISTFSNRTEWMGIIPSIEMKHLLTRFTFEVVAGNDGHNSLFIDTLGIRSYTKGTLTVAKKGAWDYDNLIVWDETAPMEMLALASKSSFPADFVNGKPATEPIDTIFIGAKNTSQRVGDALFVQPGKTQYQLYLRLKQWTQGTGGIIQELWTDDYLPIKNFDNSPFERGKSYHIKIVVYGINDISLIIESDAWDF